MILRIRLALRKRSSKDWSVRGGRGSAYGWLTIASPPSRMEGQITGRVGAMYGVMPEADRFELGELLGLGGVVDASGVSIPDTHDHYREYIDRAEGRAPRVQGQDYWA